MKPRDLIFILIIIVIVGGLSFLSTRNRAKALTTNIPEHLSTSSRKECLTCHLPEKMSALEIQHKHPGKWKDERVNCLLCHTQPKAVAPAGK